MPKLCTIDGCAKTFRARGLCATHYNQQHQPNRHRKVEVQCEWCSKTILKDSGREKRYANLYCGEECRDASRREATRLRHSQMVKYIPPPAWVKVLAAYSIGPTSSGILFTAGYCPTCSRPTTVHAHAVRHARWSGIGTGRGRLSIGGERATVQHTLRPYTGRRSTAETTTPAAYATSH